MKKQNKKILKEMSLFLFLGVLIQYFLLKDYVIKNDVLTNIVTFLSIVFGFYITSFSIFSTSTYVSELYQVVDREDKNQTLLNLLIFKYKVGLLVTLISILYFILVIFLLNQDGIESFSLNNKYTYPLISIFLFNFYYGYRMFEILVKIITQESKIKKQ
jgi:hypothetical protein